MSWGTLVGTIIGAVLGIGSTLTADRVRWRRERALNGALARRELYGQFLGALIATRMKLSELLRDDECGAGERRRQASNLLHGGGAYELRYQIRITAPSDVVDKVEVAFQTLRSMRDCVAEGLETDSPEYTHARELHRAAASDLTAAMRHELASHLGADWL
ncbi:hypothetical protein GCM10009864_57120 [Streptomyces lunalinharesii]|uniref:Secreted protein n=1 Tax=Streptomyces lunalinharesii TaxID=333384 RepID=A0ABP6EVX6_9ACTN